MERYEYQVVPFVGHVDEADRNSARTVATQLQHLINQMVAAGWEFYRIDQVQVVVQPGCIPGLFGRHPHTISFDQVTFRRVAT